MLLIRCVAMARVKYLDTVTGHSVHQTATASCLKNSPLRLHPWGKRATWTGVTAPKIKLTKT